MSPLRIESGSDKVVIMGSRRRHGSMKHAGNEHGQHYRQLFLRHAIRPVDPAARLAMAAVRHGSDVRVISDPHREVIPDCDALVTPTNKLFLAVTYADCPPVALFDPKARLAGVAHCGYKSLAAGVIENILEVMRELGASRRRIVAVVGPHIGVCCYEFGLSLARQKFGAYPGNMVECHKSGNKCRLDLGGIIEAKLVNEEKLSPVRIKRSRVCTHCGSEDLFSARKDRTDPVQAGLFGIMLT